MISCVHRSGCLYQARCREAGHCTATGEIDEDRLRTALREIRAFVGEHDFIGQQVAIRVEKALSDDPRSVSSHQIAEDEQPDLERILGCLSRSDRAVIEKLGAEIERLRIALDRYRIRRLS